MLYHVADGISLCRADQPAFILCTPFLHYTKMLRRLYHPSGWKHGTIQTTTIQENVNCHYRPHSCKRKEFRYHPIWLVLNMAHAKAMQFIVSLFGTTLPKL